MQILTDLVQVPNSWHSITNPIWIGNSEDIRTGLPFSRMSPYWQMFLLGDGAPTRHLQLLTQSDIVVDVIAMTDIGNVTDNTLIGIDEIPAPRIRRQIWLKSATTGEIFSHATSWWQASTMEQYLKDPSLPIWKSLNQEFTELYRDLKGVYQGYCPELVKAFGYPDPYWGRHYLLWHGGVPLTLIYEIYSPAIAKYLGADHL
ncbi:4-hydroxybenzoate synthetase (chorismate lyase) [Synechococcus sp. PCC 7502]|uniref:chorismate lyase n=1 Tax=Synechococcus sp. PCC 7502 TaxID=1173263 RepID=UPI00029F9E66|nr:chorismate lyase [Synechococcus sp. PCC 7502]AFY72538.1 4-hydroxybenzoate synthetase (chorismate lyase) [Synechococcus sp. PCC 7502]